MDEVSIIFPVHNERKSIERVLDEWSAKLTAARIPYVFVVCEDGSTDGTGEFLKVLKGKYPMILNQVAERRGYGAAVVSGIRDAATEFILCVDFDGQCDPQDFAAFWKERNAADVLIGWRKKREDSAERKIYSGLFKRVFYLLFPAAIHDPSAPYVLFRKSTVLPGLPYLTYLSEGFWWGFVGWAVRKKLSIRELPVHHRSRLAGETRVYTFTKLPGIAFRNLTGLVQLKFARIT